MNQNNDEQPNAGMQLLASVRYFLSSSLPQDRQDDLRQVLDSNGATPAATLKDATHIITNSHRFEGSGEVEAGVHVVTDQWVDRSLVLGKMQQPQFYSPDPAMIFSGVVACAAELPTSDLEVLSAGITALGGQWRTGLTKDVTHLFAITPNSQKYATALHFQELTQVKVILPHWFDDAVRLGMGGLSIAPYEWPDPPLLKGKHGVNYGAKKDGAQDGTEQDEVKKSLYATAVMYTPADGSSPPIRPPSPGGMDMNTNTHLNNVWGGRRILLSRTLRLFAGRRDAVEVGIQRCGGEIVRYAGDDEEDEEDPDEEVQEQKEWEMDRKEADALKECDILVTRWRSGRPYVRAFRSGKTIGTLAWVFHVQSTGILSRPLDQLLHYPVPKKPIENFSLHEITVTNYTGEAREYLKKLITAMGATFTPSMTGKNTVLIAAFLSGTKATKALSWSIPVVNHTWLEDCFVQWRNLTVGVEKYIVFPPGVDFSTLLGERGVGVGRGIEEEVKEMGDDDDEWGEGMQGGEAPRGTDASMREVQGLVDGDVHMVDGGREEHNGMDVDGPAPGEDFRFDEDEDEEEEEEMRWPAVKSKPNGALSSGKKVPAASSPSKPSSSTTKPTTRKSPVKLVPVAIPPKTPTKNKAKAKELVLELSPLSPVKSVVGSPVKSPVKSAPASPVKAAQVKSRSGPSSKKAVRMHEEDEDEEEAEEEEEVIPAKSKSGHTSKKKTSTRTHEEEQEEEDEVEVTPAVNPKSKAGAPSKSKPGPSSKRAPARVNEEDNDDDDEEEEEEVTTPAIKSKQKLGSSSKRKSTRTQDAEEERHRVSAAKSKSGSSSKRKPVRAREEDEDEEDEVQITPARKKASRAVVSDVSDQEASEEEEIVKPAKKSTKSGATTSSSAKEPVAATPSSAKPKANGKAAAAKNAPPSEDSDEEQKMDVDEEEDDDSDVVLVEEVKPRRKLVKRVTRDAEGDSATKTSSILKTTKGDARTRVKKKKVDEGKSKTKAAESDEEQQAEEEEEEEEVAPKKKEKPKSKAAPSKKPTSTKKTKIIPVESSSDSDEAPVGKLKKLEVHADEDSDADLPAPPPKRRASAKDGLASGSTTKGAPPRERTRTLSPSPPPSDFNSDGTGCVLMPGLLPVARTTVIPEKNNVKTKEKNVKVNGKAKAKEPVSSAEEEEEEEEQEEEEEEERIKVKKAALKRTESIKAAARERGHDSLSRASTSKAKATPNDEGSTSKQQSPVKNKGTPATSTSAKDKSQPKVKKAPVPSNESTPTTSISTAPPRRNAATKATQKLHDVIMPDMNNFEQQMKKSRKSGGGVNGMEWNDGKTRETSVGKRRKRASELRSDRMDVDGEQDEEEEDAGREKKRVKLSASAVGKGKGRAVSSDGDEEEELSRKSPVKSKGKSKHKQAEREEDDDATPPPVTISKGAKGKKAEEVDNDPSSKSSYKNPVRVMTTQVTLGEDVIKALTKLGVKMTTRPSECTHLLAAQLVRTEKFLCALSGSPFILTDKWATASAAAKKLLPEKDFILRDKAGEKKYNVDLAKSLKRAKESGGKLLEGKTFYITPRIKIDVKLLRNVITANGGQVGNSAPTARILGANPDRYIISCVEDISIWRPISKQDFPIYTQELVLNGALRQEVEFDNDEYRVEGSF